MKVTYTIRHKGDSDSYRISIGALNLSGFSVTIEGDIDEIKKFIEYLEIKYDLA